MRKRFKFQEKSNRGQYDAYSLDKEYSVSEMIKFLKKNYNIDFYDIECSSLRKKAVSQDEYLIDIAADIKELLNEDKTDKYFYIDVLLTEFKKNIEKEIN